jgi:hypothetical protein
MCRICSEFNLCTDHIDNQHMKKRGNCVEYFSPPAPFPGYELLCTSQSLHHSGSSGLRISFVTRSQFLNINRWAKVMRELTS